MTVPVRRAAFVRHIDELGRLVLPKEMRESLGLGAGSQVVILPQDEGILLRPFQPGCSLCGGLPSGGVFPTTAGGLVCRSCAAEVGELSARLEGES